MDALLDTAPCGFLSFSDNGKILAANSTLLQWLGYPLDVVQGQHIETLLPVASRIFYQTHFFPLLKLDGKVEEVYFSMRTAGGEDLPMLVNAVRHVRNEAPVYDCIFMVMRQRSRFEDEILNARRLAEEARLWLSTTLQSIGDAVIATDAQGMVVFVNPIAEELTGWPQDQAMGRPLDEVFQIINEETRQPVESPVTKVLREKRIVGLANHTLLVARDGSTCPIDDSGAPIRNRAGEILGVVLVFRDFTERRQTEQALHAHQMHIEILNHRLQRAMTETHHRVKNNLQLISALIDMQRGTGMETVPMSEFVRLGQNVSALGVIHDVLTMEAKSADAEGQVEHISAKAVFDKLLPMLQNTMGDRLLHFTTEDTLLPGRQVTSLALITNELVSNAIKHGKGKIELHFRVEDQVATLEVLDDGPGFPAHFDAVQAANTGLELIENISRWDLQGQASYQSRSEGGGHVTIAFPLPTSLVKTR